MKRSLLELENGGKIVLRESLKQSEPEIENGGEIVPRIDVKRNEPGLEKTDESEAKNNAKVKYKGKENGRKTTFLQKVSKLNLKWSGQSFF